jgi:hypothetical protein
MTEAALGLAKLFEKVEKGLKEYSAVPFGKERTSRRPDRREGQEGL